MAYSCLEPLMEQLNSSGGISLSWSNVSVWARRRKTQSFFWSKYENTQILHNVSGIVKSGTLLAIMGPSGAGKTTLLATISQRKKGETEGDIFINGHPVDHEFMTHISGFMPQQDLAVDTLTVWEHMEFMACLKMDCRTRPKQRLIRINSLLSELSLMKCKNTRLSSLSGGERKRLSLAVQLLTDPPLLFCDEPTTGLDSYSASIVVEKLRYLASRGKAVVCTIHQPASGIFDLFSEVLLLASGRVAFYGDVAGAANHFNSLNLICPETFNQADFYISQLAIISGQEEQCSRKIQWLCNEFETSIYGQKLAERLEVGTNKQTFFLSSQEITGTYRQWSSTFNGSDGSSSEKEDEFQKCLSIQKPQQITQLYWLAWRSLIDIVRNSSQNLLRAGLYMLIALLLATPYTNIKVDQNGIQNVQGLLYLIITETIFTFSYGVFHTFPKEIPIFLREIANGLYKPGPYYLSKMLTLLPKSVIEPLMYSAVIFWIAGLTGGIKGFFFFCIPVIFSAISATAYGCVMSASFESVSTASLLSVPIDFLTLTFSGIFLHLGNLPMHLSWIRYISQFYYGTEAVSILQWEQIHHIKCSDDPEIPCISNGMEVLEKYGYGPNNYRLDLLGLLGIYSISHILGFLAICIRSKQQPIY